MARKKILLVDDHPIIRRGLRLVIDADPGLSVCGEAESELEALSQIQRTHPDLLVVDLSLKDSSGLDLIRHARELYPDLLVLVLSMFHDSFHVERVLRAGAMGFLGKDEPTENLLGTIHKVLAGEICLSEKMTEKLVGSLVMDKGQHHEGSIGRLSQRELQVFEMIGLGNSTRMIAQRLELSVKTVETYRAKIKAKLELTDATQLLQRAVQWAQCARQEGIKLPSDLAAL